MRSGPRSSPKTEDTTSRKILSRPSHVLYLSNMSKRAIQSLRHYLRQVVEDAAPPDDESLLRQFIEADDHRAFEILLDRHGPMVLGTARRLVNNRADADDVFQATFLSLARLAKTIRQGKTLANWLYTTTCRTAARARQRRSLSIDNTAEPSAPQRQKVISFGAKCGQRRRRIAAPARPAPFTAFALLPVRSDAR